MFRFAEEFNQDLSNWDFTEDHLSNFLDFSAVNSTNFDLLINKLVSINLLNGTLGAFNIKYCDVLKRQELIDLGWTINDGGIANDCNIGVNDFDFTQVKFYPNPIRDILYIDLPNYIPVEQIQIFDLSGKLVEVYKQQSKLDLSSLEKGFYILKLETTRGEFHRKLVKN
jgi:hypothetical protein